VTQEHAEGSGGEPANEAQDTSIGGDKQTENGKGAGNGGGNGGPGAPTDAIAGLGAALLKAAETKPTSSADPNVSAAFALGWHMSELYDEHSPRKERDPPDLPGLGELRKQQPLAVVIDQVEVGVNALQDLVTKAGLDPIDLTGVKALTDKKTNDDPVLASHDQLLAELTAADPRLGTAYGLGRALADSCREPADLGGLKKELSPFRIANLLRWLDDLASALPAHAGHSVATSLGRWSDALYPPNNGRLAATRNPWKKLQSWRQRRRRPKPLDATDADKVDEAVKALRRQGELWRALLSGEKQGQDMLEIDNYLDAGKELARRIAGIVRRAVLKMPLLMFVVAVLVGVGVWLLSNGDSGHLVAGATSVLVGLGLTWKGLGTALGQLAGKLEQPLWGAVLDDAIAEAITLLPDNKAESGGRREVARSLAAGPRTEDQDAKQAAA
jgi:hypothetical protein